jgi:hypothetical protein
MIKLRQEKKLREYASNFLREVSKQILDEYKFIFFELEKHKLGLIKQETENEILKVQLQKA